MSLEAKDDRHKDIIPVRVTYTCEADETSLIDHWADIRTPTGYEENKPDLRRLPSDDESLFVDSEASTDFE